MNKQIFILNGTAGSGKDTFAATLNTYISTKHISSITPVKEAAKTLGWNGEKTPEYRNFLSDFKAFLNSHGNFIQNYLDKQVEDFIRDEKAKILLIDIREPIEIKKYVKKYNAKTILIRNPFAENKTAVANLNNSDSNVLNYGYDYVVLNNSNMSTFKENIKAFADYLVKETDKVEKKTKDNNKNDKSDMNSKPKDTYAEAIALIDELIKSRQVLLKMLLDNF